MLMLSRSDMIWTMPVLSCHFQIEAIQMKLRWWKNIVLLPSEWCTTVEVDPMSKKLLCNPDTRSKNGFGAKNSKDFKPFGPYPPSPTSGHGTTSWAPLGEHLPHAFMKQMITFHRAPFFLWSILTYRQVCNPKELLCVLKASVESPYQ